MDPRAQYVFPPEAYMHPPPDPVPATLAVPSPGRSSPSVASSPSPPKKRGRGRPPGLGKKDANTVAKAAAKAAKAKATVKTRKKAKQPSRTELKENDDPNTGANIAINISDSENEELCSKRRWTNVEKTKVYTCVLAFDPNGDRCFVQLQTSPNHVWKRAEELVFSSTRTESSIKSLWTRSMDTFTWMIAFEKFTANGGGDPDSDNPTAILKGCIDSAREAGLVIGGLKPETITAWHENGWWDLFNDRLGANAKVTRTVVRNSASALSDPEDDPVFHDSDNIDPQLRIDKPAPPASAADPLVADLRSLLAAHAAHDLDSEIG
ncbi:hypothetical protein B0H17DRAFT_1203899 [Mycena rosella]|uniref:Uncharacterized protein n=1 Tax=Mycena rosella TaxID=1033263 RepID=A0AAD7DB43_MYCRO|nr:hypothetical protein B0H17DRAFT_1203899 [Mycena rosella]